MLYDNLKRLCSERNTTLTKLLTEELKISSSKGTAWKNGSIPKYEYLKAIADYFGVSIGYLFDGGERFYDSDLTENDRTILQVFRQLTETQQGEIIGRAKSMAENNKSDSVKNESTS